MPVQGRSRLDQNQPYTFPKLILWCSFVTATMLYSMRFNPTHEIIDSTPAIEESYSKLGIIVNDIHSFDKELRAWNATHSEGASLLNLVYLFADDTGLPYEAAKRVLWKLTREWELEFLQLIAERELAEGGCSKDLKLYLTGLEYVLAGNERWSEITGRYHSKE